VHKFNHHIARTEVPSLPASRPLPGRAGRWRPRSALGRIRPHPRPRRRLRDVIFATHLDDDGELAGIVDVDAFRLLPDEHEIDHLTAIVFSAQYWRITPLVTFADIDEKPRYRARITPRTAAADTATGPRSIRLDRQWRCSTPSALHSAHGRLTRAQTAEAYGGQFVTSIGASVVPARSPPARRGRTRPWLVSRSGPADQLVDDDEAFGVLARPQAHPEVGRARPAVPSDPDFPPQMTDPLAGLRRR
jgi:hypothetical protein